MEFWKALDRSRPAPCERGDQSFGTRRCQSSPYARIGSQGRDQGHDDDGSTEPELGHEETTMFRAVAARLNNLSQDRPDIKFATMKLCSKMSRLDHRVHGLGVCLNGRLIQVPCTPLLTRIRQETDSQERRSAEA